MSRDAYLNTSSDARKAFEQAVYALAAHRPSTSMALQATLAADPDHVAAHALRGFANLILARSELAPKRLRVGKPPGRGEEGIVSSTS
ncbi:hypothetical protein [Rhizobium laguerreae]|uniref:hypothetical protein n=1 Tax=Rhizobium laguerreae TaxID=1076926 RepID=UPI001FF027B6|nr:hypothetical protein [Rhizobium laguerreae]